MENHEQNIKKAEWRQDEKIYRYALLDSSLQAFDVCGVNAGSLGLCGRYSYSNDVGICVNMVNGGLYIQSLQHCHSVSSCPVCSYDIGVQRANEIGSFVWCARKFGLGVYLVTLTCRHWRDMCVKSLFDRLGKSCNDLFRSHETRDYLRGLGYIGRITSYEVMMLGSNGYHPHYHILIVAQENLDAEIIGLELLRMWKTSLEKNGLTCNDHGLDCLGYDGVGHYITKMQSELCLLNFKRSFDSSVTPFQCLKIYHETGNEEVAKIWVDYCKTVKGRRVTVWSRGLKALACTMRSLMGLKIDAKPNDPRGIIMIDNKDDISKLKPSHWQELVKFIQKGKLEFVEEILKSVSIRYVVNNYVLKECQDVLDW